MKLKFAGLVLIILIAVSCSQKQNWHQATVAFYNTENLFDTINDPKVKDEEFLPSAERKWTSERYEKKIDTIARALASIHPADLPAVIGLCEIENRGVLKDLIHAPALKAGHYKIIHVDSPDARGIDVGFLYRKDRFKDISYETLKVDPGFATRDILHVYGIMGTDSIHFFVNHWPSRWGGAEQSEPNRIVAATVLHNKIAQILQANPQARIIIMGDMNDEPFNQSIFQTLGAKAPGSHAALVNLMIPLKKAGKGSYNYHGEWDMLDNLIVSQAVLHGKGLETHSGHIFHVKWMEYKNKEGQDVPSRTYGGPHYYGGVSDHFPVYLQLSR